MKKGIIIGISILVALIVGGYKIYTAELKKQAAEQEKITALKLAEAAEQEKLLAEKAKELTEKKIEEAEKQKLEIEGPPDLLRDVAFHLGKDELTKSINKNYIDSEYKREWRYDNYTISYLTGEKDEYGQQKDILRITVKNKYINIPDILPGKSVELGNHTFAEIHSILSDVGLKTKSSCFGSMGYPTYEEIYGVTVPTFEFVASGDISENSVFKKICDYESNNRENSDYGNSFDQSLHDISQSLVPMMINIEIPV